MRIGSIHHTKESATKGNSELNQFLDNEKKHPGFRGCFGKCSKFQKIWKPEATKFPFSFSLAPDVMSVLVLYHVNSISVTFI